MRTGARAKIEEDIAALAKEVSELRRRRGAGLPDADTLVNFVLAALGHDRARQLAEAAGYQGIEWSRKGVSELQVAPGGQQLHAAAVATFEAFLQEDLEAFTRSSPPLREALTVLLQVRAQKWWRLQAASQFYPPSWQSTSDPAEHARAKVTGLTRWEVLVWAGNALACAAEDVWRWQLWQAGWREYQEDSRRRGATGMSEQMWQWEVLRHTLPEPEALIVDSWPVPPDDQWPDRNTRELDLPRLRKWQAEQREVDGANDQEQQG